MRSFFQPRTIKELRIYLWVPLIINGLVSVYLVYCLVIDIGKKDLWGIIRGSIFLAAACVICLSLARRLRHLHSAPPATTKPADVDRS